MVTNSRLNSIQESILRLFDRDMSEEEILTLRRMLVRHYSKFLRTEVERVVEEKGYSQEDFDRMINEGTYVRGSLPQKVVRSLP